MSNRRNRSTHVVRQLLTIGSILHGQVGTDNLTESRQSPGNPLIEIPRGLASTDRPGMGHELEDVPFSSGSHPCDRGYSPEEGLYCRLSAHCIRHRSSVSIRGAVGTSEALTTLVIRSFRSISMVT